VFIVEDSGNVEAEIQQHYDNLRCRLEADNQAALEQLRSLRASKAKLLQTTINELETSRLELEGYRKGLSHFTDADVIRENFTSKWKPSAFEENRFDSAFVIKFRQNSLLTQQHPNVIGRVQLLSTRLSANDNGKTY